MRTTLDIDADVLSAAKEMARAKAVTAGKMISELARKGLRSGPDPAGGTPTVKNGFPVLPGKGNIVTVELVERLLEEDD